MKPMLSVSGWLRFRHRNLIGRSQQYLANVCSEVKMWRPDLHVALSDIGADGVYVLVAQDWLRGSVAMLGYREPDPGRGEFFGLHQARVCAATQPDVAARYVIEQVAVLAAVGLPGHCSGGGGPRARGTLLPLPDKDNFPLPNKGRLL